ncbi:glycoside hydrolase [Novosphingobium barchaimii LL02]|uniref:Glycoside hydrolase n=1 Tax=Novosphingobium barchaimii LL02 TaxID=1114963 RepID=A0A0J7XI89_9SPHN|nr:glycoside hydrolase family 16 protein [Novosphingobium barchaimii]KMS50863.1 glycoside hydrolase [Novosphingobium barchaimii LL02]
MPRKSEAVKMRSQMALAACSLFTLLWFSPPRVAGKPAARADQAGRLPPSTFVNNLTQARLGTPSFDEQFNMFDSGTDQQRPKRPHRWRTVYGYGGPHSVSNRQMSSGSFASDASFMGMTPSPLGRVPLGLDPFLFERGQLTILAQRTPQHLRAMTWNKPYYGGAITTKFSFAQKYGYFEIEARLPAGKGMWPAFWLMPLKGTWPDTGEIDIMEGLGDPRTIYCTVIAGKGKKTTRVRLNFDASAAFHRYGLLWGPSELIWFVDRKPVAKVPTPRVLTTQKAYMIANLAIGGAWGGYPDKSTRFPGRYEVRRITAWPHPDM